MSEITFVTYSLEDAIGLYGAGMACGILLSLFPMVFGSIINFALKLMKGG